MAAPDRSEERSSNVEYGSCLSKEGTNPESSSHCIENVVRVRKPYTATKQREKWSEEEHVRFLEAIKLYGRGWRQIEEHIGTKTAVQIRSHAQKFFSKMAQETDNRSEGSAEQIVIPPPRPKRRPARSYPRKSPVPYSQSSPSNFSAMDNGTNSPTSVLSSFVPEDQINGCFSPNSCTSDTQFIAVTYIDKKNGYATSKQFLKEDAANGSSSMSSITLFGKIVLVAESHEPASYRSDDNLKSMAGEESRYSEIMNSTLHVASRHVNTDLSLGVWETSCTGSNAFGSVTEVSENLEKSTSGFSPYKRCLSEREIESTLSLIDSAEQNSRRTRVCS